MFICLFFYRGKYGFTNVGKQELTLVQVSSHNDRVFERGKSSLKGHFPEIIKKNSVRQ